MTQDIRQRHLDAWIAVFVALEQAGLPTRERLAELATPDVRFKDPFNDIRGYQALHGVLEHSLRNLAAPRFVVADVAWSKDCVYLLWEMTARVKVLGDWSVTGMSRIAFAADGRIAEHVDYWDAAEHFYGRLPLLGWVLRRLRRLAQPST